MELRELTMEVARIAQDAGRHALTDQTNPRDLKGLQLSSSRQSTLDEEGSAQPILGVVHAPGLGLTYLAAKGQGAIRIRKTPIGDKREKIMPSTTEHLDGSVVSYGMSYVPEESKRALAVVSAIAGRPADIKRVGPASLDLCKVADGTYDAYFEPNLHKWDVPAMSAGAVVIWEAQAKLRTWNGGLVHWRRENDVVASNGLIVGELRPYLEAALQ